ncbi:MAG TPA: branched-chain amino acid ABC transporter permease [Conexibacter sp.]
MLVQVLAQGLSVGAVLALSALGLTVIYGVMGVVNLAHGEFVMLGAYSMAILSGPLGPWTAIALTPLIVGAIGLVVDRALIRWLYQNPVKSMLGTFGLGIVIRQLVLIAEGPGLRYVDLPITSSVSLLGEQLPVWRLVLIALAIVTGVVVALWLSRSAAGLKVRIATADADVASTLGTNVSRVNALAFALGTALAGLAGALVAPLNSVYPNMGVSYLVGAFLVVILAGLGSIRNALLWAAGVGLVTAAVAVPQDDVLAQVVVWTLALVIVALRRQTLVVSRV